MRMNSVIKNVTIKGPINALMMSLSNFLNTGCTCCWLLQYLYQMDEAKIQLSEEELQLALNESVILTKNRVIEKVCAQWEELAALYIQLKPTYLPAEVLNISHKVSRGESYNGLPWVMLDYPRCFTRNDIFSIRTMFWWGHDLSITLHLKGVYQQTFHNQLARGLEQPTPYHWWIQESGGEWQHHYTPDTHKKAVYLREAERVSVFRQNDFVKITSYLPLANWNNVTVELTGRFLYLAQILSP